MTGWCPTGKRWRGCTAHSGHLEVIPLYILRNTLYNGPVIKTFHCKDTAALFNDHFVARFSSIERQVRRKLLYLNSARSLQDLSRPPGNHLESLKGDRAGQHSIRINDQWRICFRWDEGNAWDVEIVDYH